MVCSGRSVPPYEPRPRARSSRWPWTPGVIELISVGGWSPSQWECRSPRVSGDGRFVVFSSFASNLVDGDTNGFADIFVRDRWRASPTCCPGAMTARKRMDPAPTRHQRETGEPWRSPPLGRG